VFDIGELSLDKADRHSDENGERGRHGEDSNHCEIWINTPWTGPQALAVLPHNILVYTPQNVMGRVVHSIECSRSSISRGTPLSRKEVA